eukprot:1829938-Rhodomonas_salina.1
MLFVLGVGVSDCMLPLYAATVCFHCMLPEYLLLTSRMGAAVARVPRGADFKGRDLGRVGPTAKGFRRGREEGEEEEEGDYDEREKQHHAIKFYDKVPLAVQAVLSQRRSAWGGGPALTLTGTLLCWYKFTETVVSKP